MRGEQIHRKAFCSFSRILSEALVVVSVLILAVILITVAVVHWMVKVGVVTLVLFVVKELVQCHVLRPRLFVTNNV